MEGYMPYGPENQKIAVEPMPLNSLWGRNNVLHNMDAEEALANGYAAVYKLEIELPKETGNHYQDAEFSTNLVVEAVQSDNNSDIEWSN
ncbi:MAG: hypothetical protein FH749_14380 [Firmicutes bacterium]|nr:hypothetical protein [Bacillota bacterium]